MQPLTAGAFRMALAARALLFASIWWILAGGAVASWWIGGPAVGCALLASVALLPPVPFSWLRFARFVPFFFLRSLQGGVDVAWRAFHPALPIAPALVDYPLRLPPGLARVFMANTVSLLPGTLGAEIEAQHLKVHVLDVRQEVFSELEFIEKSVAGIFGIRLDGPGEAPC